MAYSNFKQTFWSKFIQHELEKKCVLVDDCWKQFEGEAKYGNTVKILGVGAPTIDDYDGTSIGAPQAVTDTSQSLLIDQAKYFNFAVDDVDKAQSVPGLMEALMEEATRAMAKSRDSYVASLAKDVAQASASTSNTTAEDTKTAVDTAILTLRENDVPIDDDVVIELAPFVYQLLRDKYIELDTNNHSLLAKGIVGFYDNCRVKVSNNLYNDSTDVYSMVRTKKAIAFVSQIDEVEAYRPDDLFSDAVKGLNVFGAKVIRPKEIYVIKAHKGS